MGSRLEKPLFIGDTGARARRFTGECMIFESEGCKMNRTLYWN